MDVFGVHGQGVGGVSPPTGGGGEVGGGGGWGGHPRNILKNEPLVPAI